MYRIAKLILLGSVSLSIRIHTHNFPNEEQMILRQD